MSIYRVRLGDGIWLCELNMVPGRLYNVDKKVIYWKKYYNIRKKKQKRTSIKFTSTEFWPKIIKG